VFWVGGSIAEAVTQGGPVGWFFVFTSGLFAFFVLRGIKVFWQIAVVFGVVGTLLIPARPGPWWLFPPEVIGLILLLAPPSRRFVNDGRYGRLPEAMFIRRRGGRGI
jgi:hypothetical protein